MLHAPALFAARRHGARIEHLCEADKIRPLPGGGWEIGVQRLLHEQRFLAKLRRRWALRPPAPLGRAWQLRARILVIAGGAIGSTELLLRNRDRYRTLDGLSEHLGSRYSTNGDGLTMLLVTKGLALGWIGTGLLFAGLRRRDPMLTVIGTAINGAGVLQARRTYDPDLGPTNSDYIWATPILVQPLSTPPSHLPSSSPPSTTPASSIDGWSEHGPPPRPKPVSQCGRLATMRYYLYGTGSE